LYIGVQGVIVSIPLSRVGHILRCATKNATPATFIVA